MAISWQCDDDACPDAWDSVKTVTMSDLKKRQRLKKEEPGANPAPREGGSRDGDQQETPLAVSK
jgi:hypothetical protein